MSEKDNHSVLSSRLRQAATLVVAMGLVIMIAASYCFFDSERAGRDGVRDVVFILRILLTVPPFIFLWKIIRDFSQDSRASRTILIMLTIVVGTNLVSFIRELMNPNHQYTHDPLFGFTDGESYLNSAVCGYWIFVLVMRVVISVKYADSES